MKEKVSWFAKARKESGRVSEIGNHVGEMQTWMQHLEQQVMSVNARLGAVENRITNSAYDQMKQDGKVVDGFKDNPNRSLALDAESIEQMYDLEKKMDSLSSSVSQMKKTVSSLKAFKKKSQQEVSTLKLRHKKQPVVMKVGGKEILIEISGIVGGLICFLVAGLLVINATEIVLSPWFLSVIGGIFLMSALLRTQGVVGFVKKIGGFILPQSRKAPVHHSDSTT